MGGPEAVIAVPEWGAHVIRRPAGDGQFDATGVYPLQVFAPGADVAAGLRRLAAEGLVSAVLTPDPLLCPAAGLARDFEVCRPFKPHYVIDPACGGFDPSKHHRQELRRAARRCRLEWVRLADHLPAWTDLYAGLVARRGVTGAADFSPAYFEALAREAAMHAVAAWVGEELAGMAIWCQADGVAYYHLSAVNDLGYANGAAYALVGAGAERFAGEVIHLGGGAGAGDGAGGLAAFKQGFANGEVMAHICGAVLDRAAYERLSAGRADAGFFPAYRGPRAAGTGAAA
ncbi:MAG: GNAT family N-acetyltransferase [Proteobacteria bacterium]|nr:GNAT family N-acetyltransferase [Pseudomonadota bacterium]